MMADALSEHLGELTVWGNGSPSQDRDGIWRRAIASLDASNHTAEKPSGRFAARWSRKIRYGATAAAAALVLLVFIGIMTPSIGHARRSAMRMPGASEGFGSDFDGDGKLDARDFSRSSSRKSIIEKRASIGQGPVSDKQRIAARHVVRRATMQLESDDVRAAFTLTKQLVSPARGEYVESADIRERNTGYEADLVLRVAADRLDEVLIELRGLGSVINDRIDTDDVTNRVVDIEARLRNERSVEAELLGLLTDRENDELQGVLAVRRELASVRQQIEVMLAQRNQIARLVSLSTITVILREPEAEPEPVEERSAWGDFTDSVGEAWRAGLRSLGEFITGLLWFAVAGLPVWILIAAISTFVWRKCRIANPKPLPE